MSFSAEVEISKLLKALHSAQNEIGKIFFRWQHTIIELSKSKDFNPLDITLRMAELSGQDVAKGLFSRLNWLKGEEVFILNFAKSLSYLWIVDGGIASVEKGEKYGNVFINCFRDPWPTWAKEYGVTMKELILYRERFLKSIVKDVCVFFNISLNIDIIKSIPGGDGVWKVRLYKKDN